MITYQANNKESAFYDFKMLTEILRVHPSFLKRAIKRYHFSTTDYILYGNRHLYRQDAIVDFVVFLVTEKIVTDIKKLTVSVNKK